MPTKQQIRGWYDILFHKSQMRRQLADELQSYEDLLTAEKIARGLAPDQARREARLEIGGRVLVEENVHDVWLGSALDSLLQDVRFALRTLARNPGFAAVAALVLALGIGSATALFTTVDRALLRPIPFPEPDRLVAGEKLLRGVPSGPVSGPDYYDFQAQNHSFTSLAALVNTAVPGTLTVAQEPQLVHAGFITWDLFRTLGVAPAAGRDFVAEDAKGPGATRTILSYVLAAHLFGGARQALGKTVHANDQSFEIVGVMPRGLHFLIDADLWIVIGRNSPMGEARDQHNYTLIGRLKPGVTFRQAQLEANGLSKALQRQYPSSNAGKSLRLTGLHSFMVTGVRTSLLLLMAVSILVLLIACGNVAGLLLARGQKRVPEMAMRTALGAPRGRLVRQLLTESVLLTLFAGALGIGVAYALQLLLLRLLPLGQIQNDGPMLDGVALLFSLGASIATGILVGVFPALRVTALNLAQRLRTGARSSEEAHGTRLRGGLVVLQVAVSAVLLVGSATLIHEMVKLLTTDPGFASDHVLTGRFQIQSGADATTAQRSAIFQSLLQQVQAQPGVVRASLLSLLPIEEPYNDWPVWPIDQPRPALRDSVSPLARWVSPGYFKTMRIPLLHGRDIADSDIDGRQQVIILSKWVADKLLPNRNPIGQLVHAGWSDKIYEVVGIAADARLSVLGDAPSPAFYLSAAQVGATEMRVVVRTSGDPESMIGPLRRVLKRNDGSVLFSEPATMDSILDKSLANSRTIVLAASLFTALALALTAVGLYGMLAFYVSTRRNEIAIRMALGATRGNVLGLVLGRGMGMVCLGLAFGAVGAYPEMTLIRGMISGAEALNVPACVSAAAVLCGAAMIACLLPAWRASHGGLLEALRSE
jgi:putative ABC transport system permease protein